VGPSDGFITEFLPAQPKELYLRELDFRITALSPRGSHLMPNLTTLLLLDLRIEGPFYRYLSFPKLKTLRLHMVQFYDPDDHSTGEEWFGRKQLPVSDVLLLRDLPELERLYLGWMDIDERFADKIRYCPKLQEFVAAFCELESFFPSLTNSLADSKAFPSLRRLRLLPSLTSLDDPLGNDFISYCAVQRPDISVSYT
jgi:hypothetical protein